MRVLSTEAEIQAEIERLEAQFQAELAMQSYARRHGLPWEGWAPDKEPDRERLTAGPLGSEPELREDEAVCPVTHLTYLRTTPCPHHYDGTPSCAA